MFASKAISWVIGTAVPAILIAVIFIIRLEGKVKSSDEKIVAQAEELKVLREKVYEPLLTLVGRFDQFEQRFDERFNNLSRELSDLRNTPTRRRKP